MRNHKSPTQVFYFSVAIAFSVLAFLAHRYDYFGWDLVLARSFQALPAPRLLSFVGAVSLLGDNYTPDAIIAGSLALFLLLRWRSEMIGLLLSTEGARSLSSVLKLLVARPRPTSELVQVAGVVGGWSFPSGHVMLYVSLFGFLFYVAYVRLARGSVFRLLALLATALPIILVGASRVCLGAHWPSDTIGAYLAGGLWLACIIEVYRRCRVFEQSEAKTPTCQKHLGFMICVTVAPAFYFPLMST